MTASFKDASSNLALFFRVRPWRAVFELGSLVGLTVVRLDKARSLILLSWGFCFCGLCTAGTFNGITFPLFSLRCPVLIFIL